MFKLFSSTAFIGLESSPTGVKGATVNLNGRTPSLNQLFTISGEKDDVKPLYINHPVITTALEGKEILVRPMHLPLTKEKDIQEALAFQAEPLLPYPSEQAFLAYQVIAKTEETTDLTLLAVRKDAIQAHIEKWTALRIEPEKISSIPSALCQFGKAYLTSSKAYLILHLTRQESTCVLVKEGRLLASFALPEGLDLLLSAQKEEGLSSLPRNQFEWQALEKQAHSKLAAALKRLQKEIVKMSYALAKELRGEAIEAIAVTGEASEWEGLSQLLVHPLLLPALDPDEHPVYSKKELLSHAVPIGLALGSSPAEPNLVDFRQEELGYPHPWKRLIKPMGIYFGLILLLSFSFYFFSQQYLLYQEDLLREKYIGFLASIHKSHEQLELAFKAKNSKDVDLAHYNIPPIKEIKQDDLSERLLFLQKELQASPDSFPLFANIPRVSDILAWLSQHPSVAFLDENGNLQTRLQIENLNYMMVKRPQQGKKQDKYQVKIELEFSSPTPKWAREFHDALIAPNDWVDPKGEVKWSSNRGKYKTSFFLKDKTSYPSL
jgi:type IV pilus assembly protein PilM